MPMSEASVSMTRGLFEAKSKRASVSSAARVSACLTSSKAWVCFGVHRSANVEGDAEAKEVRGETMSEKCGTKSR